MKRRGDDVVIVSQSAWGGTSACSGSDKQTLHTANTADQGDNYKAMARAIRSGGAMDEDTAYVEAVGSSRMMASLQFLGLPLPQDPLGGTLRYQTDHDEVGRATSCGPRTSRLMVKVLAEEAIRLGVPFYNQTTAVKILTGGDGDDRHVVGILAMRASDRTEENPLGIALFVSGVIVLAVSGPGELYRDSVYPNGCFGSLGLALEVGVELVNLTESQFGIGTRREGFPWNLSGTYVQAIPHIYSVDSEGREHHFLAEYYRSTQELASNVFRKGYQWPFHATRMLDFGSSLVDLAIASETAAGRRVFMDFNRNPLSVPGNLPFSLERLDEDVREYLGKARRRPGHADRSLEAYESARDRALPPLQDRYCRKAAGICGQQPAHERRHHGRYLGPQQSRRLLRGWRSGGHTRRDEAGWSGAQCRAGLRHPGGRAHQRERQGEAAPRGGYNRYRRGGHRRSSCLSLRKESPLTVKSIRFAVQARMSEKAGIICDQESVGRALVEARKLNAEIRTNGIAYSRAAEAVRGVQWRHMALTSEAVLSALDFFIRNGGGSRGARAICDAKGESLPLASAGPLQDYRFRKEREVHRKEQIVVRLDGDEIRLSTRANRTFDESARSFFERDWPAWLTGRIYDLDAGN